ncbi:protein PERCC1 [Elgaria multicarinata webbii]|uniref:protein PERCC1 n=1 Tax=Elgaria multicarinata webbii TaxID=159646 RepID=UPI002FCD5675
MAAGVIQSLSKFRLPAAFQPSFLPAAACQEMIFQDFSEEEEMEEGEEEEEEEEREDMEPAGRLPGCSAGRGEQATGAVCSPRDTEMTLQLLRFAERISGDIQRYFGRKSKEEDSDSCNIYQDCCSPRLSGRVLYYTDLVRISQSWESGQDEGCLDSSKPPPQPDRELWRSFCSQDEAEKLGPLTELFEYGLGRYVKEQVSPDNKKLSLDRKYAHVAPMHSRKLPQSFWKEPSFGTMCILNGNPPDFSDLLANWTSETSQEELNAIREQASEANRRVVDADHFSGL